MRTILGLLALSWAAGCAGGGDPDGCQSPLCHVDGVCDAGCLLTEAGCDDPDLPDNDPDCDPCLYEGTCDFCLYEVNADTPECLCEGPNPPDFCTPMVPEVLQMSAVFAYDPTTGTGRSFRSAEGAEVQPSFTVLVTSERYAQTNDPMHLCGMRVEATAPLQAAPFASPTIGPDDPPQYQGTGVTFAAGAFTVSDHPVDASGNAIAGCSEWSIDPKVWGDASTGMADAIAESDWTFAWTNMASVIQQILEAETSDDPDNDFDDHDLHQEGLVAGGVMDRPGSSAQSAYYISLGFDVDGDWRVLDSGRADDPAQRIPAKEMVPEQGTPRAGVYEVRSYHQWDAAFILLDDKGQ